MLPPALGGLRVMRTAGPGPLRTREYGKDQCRAVARKTGELYHTALQDGKGGILEKFSKMGKFRVLGCQVLILTSDG